jgi:hypothetical protein
MIIHLQKIANGVELIGRDFSNSLWKLNNFIAKKCLCNCFSIIIIIIKTGVVIYCA